MLKAKIIAVFKALSMAVVLAALTAMLSMVSCVPKQIASAHSVSHMTPVSAYRYQAPVATIQLTDSRTNNLWKAAIKAWNRTHAFTFKIVNSNAQIKADSFSSLNDEYRNTTGITYTRYSGNQLLSAKTQLNRGSLALYHYNINEQTNVAEHELGHTIGLLHNPGEDSVMYYRDRYVAVQPVDIAAVKKDYGTTTFEDTFNDAPIISHTFIDPVTIRDLVPLADQAPAFSPVRTLVEATKANPG